MRARRFPREDFAPLRPYDPGRTPVEVDLSDNTNLWGPSPEAMEVIRSAMEASLTRYPSVYATDLKGAVARSFGIPSEHITTGCGSDDLLDSAFRAATVPPGAMSFPDPTFSMVATFGRMNGLEAHPVPWDQAREEPETLLARDPDLVYVCRPNNPTGHSPPKAWVRELLERVGPQGPLVIMDEAYADFAQDHLLEEAVESDRLLVLRTFSKLYGLAGLRVGFAIGPAHLIREVEKSRGPYKVNRLGEDAAVASLYDATGWRSQVVRETLENRGRLAAALGERGLAPLPSEANFLLVPLGSGEGSSDGTGSATSALEIDAALKARGVAIRPFPQLPGLGDALRVTVGPWPLMQRFLGALDDVLEEGGGPT